MFAIVPAASAADAPDSCAVAKIISVGEIALADWRILHLDGIREPVKETQEWVDKVRQALQELTDQCQLALEDISTDRQGRVSAQAYAPDVKGGKIWLQGEMLKRGPASVYPPTGDEAPLDDLRVLEAEARRTKTGIRAEDA